MSIATVSRAPSTRRTWSKPQTRERRVLEAAAGLGYTPNRAARGLITGRTGNVGLIVPDVANPFFPALIKGAQARARARDHSLFLADTDEDPHTEEQVIRAMAKQVDGVIAVSSRMSDAKLGELASLTSVVLVNRRSGAIPAVVIDMTGGMRQAVEHLRPRPSQPVFLGRPSRVLVQPPASPRAAGHGRPARDEGHGAGAVRAGLRRGHARRRPRAGRGAERDRRLNDLMALGVLGRLSDRGVAVPGDVSVVGFDDIQMAALTTPALRRSRCPPADRRPRRRGHVCSTRSPSARATAARPQRTANRADGAGLQRPRLRSRSAGRSTCPGAAQAPARNRED